jgi:hypothetical protein
LEANVLELLLTGTVLFKGSAGAEFAGNFDDTVGGVALPERGNAAGVGLANEEFSGRPRVSRAKRRQVMRRAIRKKGLKARDAGVQFNARK